jgi:hypothetical protein
LYAKGTLLLNANTTLDKYLLTPSSELRRFDKIGSQ